MYVNEKHILKRISLNWMTHVMVKETLKVQHNEIQFVGMTTKITLKSKTKQTQFYNLHVDAGRCVYICILRCFGFREQNPH